MKELHEILWSLLVLIPLCALWLHQVRTEGRRGRYWAGLAKRSSIFEHHPRTHSAAHHS